MGPCPTANTESDPRLRRTLTQPLIPNTATDGSGITARPNSVAAPPAKPSGLELVSEVSDLGAGLGILTFALASLALPGLALTALAVVPLLIPVLAGALLAAPLLLVRRLRRARDLQLGAPKSGRER
jgi:hypothetical protein